jgi:hypothetical protein
MCICEDFEDQSFSGCDPAQVRSGANALSASQAAQLTCPNDQYDSSRTCQDFQQLALSQVSILRSRLPSTCWAMVPVVRGHPDAWT